MSENSLIIFTQASKMLAEANTILKAKELKDLALTAADWAKRKGMGEEAIQYAKSYALDAERKMGQMLQEVQKASGGQPYRTSNIASTSSPKEPVDATVSQQKPKKEPIEKKEFIEKVPTLKEVGLTKKESFKAQQLAKLPEMHEKGDPK